MDSSRLLRTRECSAANHSRPPLGGRSPGSRGWRERRSLPRPRPSPRSRESGHRVADAPPRLQWRDRAGLRPASLFLRAGASTPEVRLRRAGCQATACNGPSPCGSDGALLSARYRIGTTSFVHPAGWLENARRVAGRVSDVEILLFEPPVGASAPSAGEIAALARLGEEAGLTYSVHAPLEIALGSEDGGRRRAAVDAVRAAVEVTAPLAPHALIVHLAAGEREGGPLPVDPAAFRRRAIDSLHEVLSSGLAPATLCLETLEYDFALAEPVVEELGLSVAIDVGHLARDGVPIDAVLARNLVRARRAAEWAGVLTLEVFREADLDDSLAVLAELEQEAAA